MEGWLTSEGSRAGSDWRDKCSSQRSGLCPAVGGFDFCLFLADGRWSCQGGHTTVNGRARQGRAAATMERGFGGFCE